MTSPRWLRHQSRAWVDGSPLDTTTGEIVVRYCLGVRTCPGCKSSRAFFEAGPYDTATNCYPASCGHCGHVLALVAPWEYLPLAAAPDAPPTPEPDAQKRPIQPFCGDEATTDTDDGETAAPPLADGPPTGETPDRDTLIRVWSGDGLSTRAISARLAEQGIKASHVIVARVLKR